MWLVGDERNLRRFHVQHEFDEVLVGIALDIQFCGDNIFEGIHITAAYVTFVRTGMDGYALSAPELAIDGCLFNIGNISSPRIAESGYFIDIYA